MFTFIFIKSGNAGSFLERTRRSERIRANYYHSNFGPDLPFDVQNHCMIKVDDDFAVLTGGGVWNYDKPGLDG